MTLRCPSAQPDMADAQVLGVVRQTGAGPRVAYVNGHAAVTHDVLDAAKPAPITSVLRFAAQCETSACTHFDGQSCTLATRIRELLPEVADNLPPCAIRRSCRWFAEQGAPICFRCPQVVTQTDRNAADPRLVEGANAGRASAS